MVLIYFAVLLFYCIFNVSTQDVSPVTNISSDGPFITNLNGWNFYYEEDATTGNVDVYYSCTEELEKDNSTAVWNSSALPDNTQSVTIENCNLDLIIESEDDVRMSHLTTGLMNLEHFNRLKIRNITNLRIGPLLSGLLLIMRGNLTISIEDVRNIVLLPAEFLNCYSLPKEDIVNATESLNFEMINVRVESVEKNSILWYDTNIPIALTWDNVIVQNIQTDAIFISVQEFNDTGIMEVPIIQDHKVQIINSNFIEDIPFNAVKGVIGDFEFNYNSIQLVENCFFSIRSKNISISYNDFNYLKNFSFSCISGGENAALNFDSNKINASEEFSIHFGMYDSLDLKDDQEENNLNLLSFHNNTFKCLNSAWMKRSEELEDTYISIDDNITINYTDIVTYENLFYENTDNLCSDVEIECMKTIKNFHHDYQIFKELWANYCFKASNLVFFTICILIILAIGVVLSISVYRYTDGNFTPGCIESSHEYEVYLAEQQRPTYGGEDELAEPIEIELKNDDEIKIKTSR